MNFFLEPDYDKIDPVDAHHVLHMTTDQAKYRQPGGFMESLIIAMLRADLVNLGTLTLSYPSLAVAVFVYKNIEDGTERLKEIAERIPTNA